jgi:hypothetical protein
VGFTVKEREGLRSIQNTRPGVWPIRDNWGAWRPARTNLLTKHESGREGGKCNAP